MNKKKIVLTGGGSAGHVTPNMALLPYLKKEGYDIAYIGSKNGIEKEIVMKTGLKYHEISSGKLRRYFDWKNFSDPFRVLKGIGDALLVLKKEKPQIVFSKGGFVVVPVVIAAKILGIPVVAHESDVTPGLANRIAAPFCKKVCLTFPNSKKSFKEGAAVVTGTPIREEIFKGSKEKGRGFCGFEEDKKVILVVGGSLGAKSINSNLRKIIKDITRKFYVVHLCGKGNVDEELKEVKGYMQYEYVSDEMKDLFAMSDMVISRAGANSIFEILALKKPNILIPLSAKQSRGDQILNAKLFKEKGYSIVLDDDNFTHVDLMMAIEECENKSKEYISCMEKSELKNGTDNIIEILREYS